MSRLHGGSIRSKTDLRWLNAIAIEHLIDANRFWRRRRGAFAASLDVSFRAMELDSSSATVRQLIDAIGAVHDLQLARRTASDEILELTSTLPTTTFRASQWKYLTQSLCAFGFLRAGEVARRHCLGASEIEFESSPDSVSPQSVAQSVCYAIERRDFIAVRRLANNSACATKAPRHVRAARAWLRLVRADGGLNLSGAERDSDFDAYIRNRKVAVVAPGMTPVGLGCEIESHDVVYRIKHFGRLADLTREDWGGRCDITFFNERGLAELLDISRLHEDQFSGVSWIVQKKSRLSSRVARGRSIDVWAPAGLTTATSGTLAVFDLLQFCPLEVKLYGFNFYSQRDQYTERVLRIYRSPELNFRREFKGAHWDGAGMASSDIAWSFIAHIPMSDFQLMRNLWQSGLLVLSPEVERVLSLSTTQYAAQLEMMLGDW